MGNLGLERATAMALNLLFHDPQRVRNITFHHITGTAWDPVDKKNIDTFVDTVAPAIPLKHTERSVKQSRTPDVQVGEQVFLVRFADVPAGINTNDSILYDGQDLGMRPLDTILDLAYVVTCYGGAKT